MERKWLEWSGASEIFWRGSGAEALIFSSALRFWSRVGVELEWSGVEAALEWSGAEAHLEGSRAKAALE